MVWEYSGEIDSSADILGRRTAVSDRLLRCAGCSVLRYRVRSGARLRLAGLAAAVHTSFCQLRLHALADRVDAGVV